MAVAFTYNPLNNIGKVRSMIQDTEVGKLVDRVVTSITVGNLITFSGANFDTNDLVGYYIFPDVASSYSSYKITANTSSTITVRGDLTNSVSSAGTSACVSEAIFTDQEITNFLNQVSSSVVRASAQALRAMAANKAKLAKKFKKDGVAGIEVENRMIKEILDLADSYDNQAKTTPASCVTSFQWGAGKQSDDFESPEFDEFGRDLNEYNRT